MPGLGVRGFKTSYRHSQGELCPKRRENNVFLSLFEPKNFGPGVPLIFMWFWSFRVFEGVTRALWAIGRVDHWNIHAGCGFWQSLPQTHLNRCTRRQKNNLVKALFIQSLRQVYKSLKISLFWIGFAQARSIYYIVNPDKSCSRRFLFSPQFWSFLFSFLRCSENSAAVTHSFTNVFTESWSPEQHEPDGTFRFPRRDCPP